MLACAPAWADWDDDAVQAARYDRVTWLTTHNAYASKADRFAFPNQTHGLERQLADGVRGLMLDVHADGDALALIHGKRWLGRTPLARGLRQIRGFLQAHPRAVVTLILEMHAPGERVAKAFEAAGLDALAHAQHPGRGWPTVGAMVASGRRLVVLANRGGGARPWFHALWEHACDTPWKAGSIDDLEPVRHGRGRKDRPLLILNHFVMKPLPSPVWARRANVAALLRRRVAGAERLYGRRPTFVAVDFYEVGDALVVCGPPPEASRR